MWGDCWRGGVLYGVGFVFGGLVGSLVGGVGVVVAVFLVPAAVVILSGPLVRSAGWV